MLIALSAVFTVLGACIAGYTYSRAKLGKNNDIAATDSYATLNIPVTTTDDISGPAMAQAQNRAVLGDDAVVLLQQEYTLCGHTVDEEITEGIAGKTEQELAERYPGATILDFSPSKAILFIAHEMYCPDHYILKSEDGKLNLYKTMEGKEEPELERTLEGVEVPSDAALEEGIVFDTLEAVELYLENIES
jgi:hypothetical protein